jgi:hypothetical protein
MVSALPSPSILSVTVPTRQRRQEEESAPAGRFHVEKDVTLYAHGKLGLSPRHSMIPTSAKPDAPSLPPSSDTSSSSVSLDTKLALW